MRSTTAAGIWLGLIAVAAAVGWLFHAGPASRPLAGKPTQPVEIFQGITYHSYRLADSPHGGGMVHVVRADLNQPGVGVYVGGPEADAAPPWRYRTRYPWQVASRRDLAVTVNGLMFGSRVQGRLSQRTDPGTGWWRLAHNAVPVNDAARTRMTAIADGLVNLRSDRLKLIWQDAAGQVHFTGRLGDDPTGYEQAVWGVGGDLLFVAGGRPEAWAVANPHQPQARCVIGVNSRENQVWLIVFEWADYRLVAEQVARHGPRFALNLDGGGSTGMVIGPGARGVEPGTRLGGYRPSAVPIGFLARRIEP